MVSSRPSTVPWDAASLEVAPKAPSAPMSTLAVGAVTDTLDEVCDIFRFAQVWANAREPGAFGAHASRGKRPVGESDERDAELCGAYGRGGLQPLGARLRPHLRFAVPSGPRRSGARRAVGRRARWRSSFHRRRNVARI